MVTRNHGLATRLVTLPLAAKLFAQDCVIRVATVLKISTDTVTRDSNLAKAWLLREMDGKHRDGF